MTTFDHPAVRWVIEQALNGNVFYGAMTLLVLAAAARIIASWRSMYRWRSKARIAFWLGAALLFISAGAMTVAWAALLGVLALAALMRRHWRTGRLMAALLALAALGWAGYETWKYETGPAPHARLADGPIVVLGDSLSASLRREDAAWPRVLQERTGRIVTNLAVASGHVATAHRVLDESPVNDSLVIVLLSGNDMLGGTPAAQYASDLSLLLKRLYQGGNAVLFLEVPAPPNAPWYGWSQHMVLDQWRKATAATQSPVMIAPRRIVADVLFGTPQSTTDGLHLTDSGQADLAKRVQQMLE